uniref:hypothetical protein n=1 Tax=Gelidibacter sp. TaxID=2018083 RepID=UPI00404A047F
MKKYLLITLIITHSFYSFSQVENNEQSGKMIKIQGLITSKATNNTLPSVIVELRNSSDRYIEGITTDFDGMFEVSFCSNKLINDTLIIKTTKVLYKQEVLFLRIKSDSIITITLDEDKTNTKEKVAYYKSQFLYFDECGLYEDKSIEEYRYKKNNTYKHYCTGEIKKYKSLIDNNENLSDWVLIKD